jgi:hypothetical protein
MKWKIAALATVLVLSCGMARSEDLADRLPKPLDRQVDFLRDVQPIFENRCLECHGRGKAQGGFRIDTRESILNGSETGRVVVSGDSLSSYLIEITGDPQASSPMPPRGDRLTEEEVSTLRAWIDQGLPWHEAYTFAFFREAPLAPREPVMTGHAEEGTPPLDRFLSNYFQRQGVTPPEPVSDRLFARRAFLDVTGLPPDAEELEAFLADESPDKRTRLVDSLLSRNEAYAENWISFWNDLLRNDYTGTGYIDGGRLGITAWLYESLVANKPYDQFVHELISPATESKGFVKGIVWRGVTNSSQTPPMQAAQNISQVFMGINLKCASCHDSFISNWKLEDSYALANIFSEESVEVHHCDSPTGNFADTGFLYEQLGEIDPEAPQKEKQEQLAAIITSDENGRFARTLVNRLWAKVMGHGLVEPTDEMDREPWSRDILDWLAHDFAASGYDIKHTLKTILTSEAYRLPATSWDGQNRGTYVFSGPSVRRLTAEQFRDAVCFVSGAWVGKASAPIEATRTSQPELGPRAWALVRDPLTVALGRPNRDQINSQRPSAATTLQGLELTNGETLAELLKAGAEKLLEAGPEQADQLVHEIYQRAYSRQPEEDELKVAREVVGEPLQREGIEDLLWITSMSPEFQLVY